MKKRILSIMLMLALVLGSVSFSFAASSFTDITDSRTAAAVEVLKLMGVVDGVGDGKYNPDEKLTRAEFCKLAVIAMHTEASFNKYSSMTIFPDVKASEWFAPYVNMAAKELAIVKGMPDGSFKPANEIKTGEAVTILLRLIGYTDEEIGGVWPYGHMNFAESAGMFVGVNAGGASSGISRGDAANLFVNAIKIDAQNKRSSFSFSGETTLKSVNIGSRTLTTKNGQSYSMSKSMSTSTLVGKTGYVVLRSGDGKAVTFMPSSLVDAEGGACIVIKRGADATELNALAGRSDYSIYKNGALVTVDKIKTGDVAVYREDENKIVVCDTKLTAMLESVDPSPANASSVTVLGGSTLDVLSPAAKSLEKNKAGSHVSLYFTADGRVGEVGAYGYTTTQNNAVFVVDTNGTAHMICGDELSDIAIKVEDLSLCGKAVRLSFVSREYNEYGQGYSYKYSFEELKSSQGNLDLTSKTLGNKKIAENALVFENGEETALKDLTVKTVSYARENANGEIDLIVVHDYQSGKAVAGYGVVTLETDYTYKHPTDYYYMTITNADGTLSRNAAYYEVGEGYFLAHDNGKNFVNVQPLSYLNSVKAEEIISEKMVQTVSGRTYNISPELQCYNKDTLKWTDLSEALGYGQGFDLYGLDGIVYVMTYAY
ncbi:MAG: S-layer homology domain-containing protein [Clostridia bacterium]|nr:S-layer homology domain-containing protein [Clostridia bacterium]